MKTKIKSFVLVALLAVLAVFATLTLTACGEVSLDTLQNNFEKLDSVYAKYSEIFTSGDCEGMNTNYVVDYGSIVNGYVSENRAEYVELSSVYNMILVISNDYIDNNKSYITNFKEENLSKEAKESLKALNESLEQFTNSVESFVSARKTLVTHFEQFNGSSDEQSDLAFLRKFKKQYGKFVEKSIDLSMNLAKSVEATEIFEILKRGTPVANDTKIIKEYVRAKMLPIFSDFKISEIENNLYWGAYSSIHTPAKQRLDTLIQSVNDKFANYKNTFVGGSENFKVMTKDQMSEALKIVEDFFVEAERFHEALSNFQISTLAGSFVFDLEEYKKTNTFAEIYLQKMEQFVETSIDNFTNKIVSYIY